MGLSDIFQDIADAIRSKTGKSESIYPVDMASEIEGISSGGGYKLEKMPSGAVSSFNDGTDLPLNKLKVSIEPVQDLHGYDHPWAGGAGKNKLKYPYYGSSTTLNGVTFTVNNDGTVNVNGTASADASFYLAYTGSDMILPQGEYTLNGCPSGGSNTTYMLNITNVSTQDIGSGANFTSDGTTSLNIQIIVRSNTTASNLLFKPMIRLASVTDATFAPYSNICPISGWDECNVNVSPTTSAEDGTTYTIQFKNGDNPLTVYGGTLDVVSGELVVDMAKVDLGTLRWTKANGYFSTSIAAGKPTSGYVIEKIICSNYKTEAGRDVVVHNVDYSIGCGTSSDYTSIMIWDSSKWSMTAQEFKTAMSGVMLVYKLANSVTYHLTPVQIRTLVGNNNIWADTGDIINGEYLKGADTRPTS